MSPKGGRLQRSGQQRKRSLERLRASFPPAAATAARRKRTRGFDVSRWTERIQFCRIGASAAVAPVGDVARRLWSFASA
jgi:hypothetical protein